MLRGWAKKSLGLVPSTGERAIVIQAFYGLRELLGQKLQTEASTVKSSKRFDWSTWNAQVFIKIVGGNPVQAEEETVTAIGNALAELAHSFLAPRFSPERDECLAQLAAVNIESIERRQANRALSDAIGAATSTMGGADGFDAEDFDGDDEDDDDDFEDAAEISEADDDDDD